MNVQYVDCTTCNGRGTILTNTCRRCHGLGQLPVYKDFTPKHPYVPITPHPLNSYKPEEKK